MKTFNDGIQDWSINMNLGTAMALRDKLGVDLLQPEQGDPPLLTQLGTDEVLLAEVIFCFLEKQITEAGLTTEDMYERFTGEVILAAQQAFYEELINFFQSRGRKDRATAVQKQRLLIQKAAELAQQKLAGVDIQKIVDGAMSGSLQDTLDSIQEDSPSGNC